MQDALPTWRGQNEQSLPQAVGAMLDPADCGPAFLALPQDIQELAFEYPEAFFEERSWRIPRPRPDRNAVADAAALLKTAKKPLIIAGGGVRYSGAGDALRAFASKRGIPVVETIAGKGGLTHDDPVHAGPIGIIGSTSANALAEAADVVLAVGTRLQDFTTGSWTAFSQDARFIAINAAHAAVGAASRKVESLADLVEALDWARSNDRATVIFITTDASAWVPGDADWDVGVPEVSSRDSVRKARAHQAKSHVKQQVGVRP